MNRTDGPERRGLLSRPGLLLVLGGLLTAAAHLRWGIGLLAWVAPIPFLRTLRLSPGWRPRLLLALVVRINRERHELVERHTVLGVDVEQL